jgi:hypothetical protein
VSIIKESIGDESEHDTLERLSAEFATEDIAVDAIARMDMDIARKNLQKKLESQGWPTDVKKDWVRVGRPRKIATPK